MPTSLKKNHKQSKPSNPKESKPSNLAKSKETSSKIKSSSHNEPKIVSFMSMSGYSSTYNSETKKPITIQETYQVVQNSTGKVTGFYEQKKNGKTIKKEPIKNIKAQVNKASNIKTTKTTPRIRK